MSENSEMEAQLDALDNEWLDAIGNNYMRMFGKPWETRDGETREEGLQSNISALFQLIEDQKSAKDKAEAACASLFNCIDSVFLVLLDRANANMLYLHEGKGNYGLPFGLSFGNSKEKKAVSGMSPSQSQGECSENRSEEKACEELACSKGKEPGTISGLHQYVSRETPGEIIPRLPETRSIQSKMQNSTSQCCCVWENKETEEMCAVRLDWSSSRASRRLQQAVERAMALHNMSRKEASQILNALSTDCGKGWISPEKARLAREALELVAECFPAHSMVKKALAALKEDAC